MLNVFWTRHSGSSSRKVEFAARTDLPGSHPTYSVTRTYISDCRNMPLHLVFIGAMGLLI